MAETASNKTPGTSVLPMIVIGALLLGGLVLMSMLGGGSADRRLNSSAIGFSALAPWLKQNDIAVRVSNARLHPEVDTLALRILPLYDTNLRIESAQTETREERIAQHSQRDMARRIFNQKIASMPSVVVLPKWRGALIETGIAHEQSLIAHDRYSALLTQIGLANVELRRAGPFFQEENVAGRKVALFHAQTFKADTLPASCQSVVAFGRDDLVIKCAKKGKPNATHYVSDPDVLNNHGMAAAGNALAVIDVLKSQLEDDARPLYIDLSSNVLLRDDTSYQRQDYDRSFREFQRLFTYPFSLFWAVFLIVLAVLFWRGARRFGPVQQVNEQGRERSKRAAIQAKARLLRLSGSDGRMVADFVRAQVQDLVQRSFGAKSGQAGEARFYALLTRRDPELGSAFRDVVARLTDHGAQMPPATLDRELDHYHSLLKKVVSYYGPV